MLPALFLTLSAILYHLLYVLGGSPANWANFSPVAAVFLCSGAFLHRRAAFLLPLLALFLSDLIINAHYHIPLFDTRMIPGYFCFVLFLILGRWLARRPHAKMLWMLGGAVTASLLFYLATNSVDWLFDSAVPYSVETYPKTFAGWIQALTVGHPNFPPTYLFLRNTLVSDLVFTSVFLLTQYLFHSSARGTAPTVAPEKSQIL
jgi:hypothetical protein